MSSVSLSEVCEYLRDYGHPDLTPKKVRNRATVVEESERSGRVIFDIERHRSVLGAKYTKGTGMAAFETYWERYVFDRDQKSLTKKGENMSEDQAPSLKIDSYDLLAEQRLSRAISFSLKGRDEGGYEAENTVMGSSRVVHSEEELLEFAREQQETMWLEIPRSADVLLEDRYGASEERIQEVLSHLKSAEIRYVEKKARWEWERAAE
jgi:hypothetical protein